MFTMIQTQVFAFFILLTGVYSQVVNIGECPKVEVVTDFDAGKYVGKWYENERYPLIFEFLGKCVTADYSAIDADTIGVYNVQINSLLGNKQTIEGNATFDGPHNEAKLTVFFPGILGATLKGTYWVLGTDYENYSVVWSCSRIANLHFISSWILTREANPSDEIIKKAYEILEKNKVDRSHFSKTDQSTCNRE